MISDIWYLKCLVQFLWKCFKDPVKHVCQSKFKAKSWLLWPLNIIRAIFHFRKCCIYNHSGTIKVKVASYPCSRNSRKFSHREAFHWIIYANGLCYMLILWQNQTPIPGVDSTCRNRRKYPYSGGKKNIYI